MAAVSFLGWSSLRPREKCSSSVGSSYGSSMIKFLNVNERRAAAAAWVFVAASAAESSSPAVSENPEIEMEFIGPKADGLVEKAKAISGEKFLRNIMLDNKIELYAAYGKVMNCGGGGSCGTCIVEILEGKDLLNERTNTELRYLKKKPESWRLACQTVVGNKENSGKVVVQRLPQWKK